METHQSYRFPFAKYPAVRLVVLLIAGILLDYRLHPPLWIWLILFTGCLILFLYLELNNRHSLNTRRYRSGIGCYILMGILFGGGWNALQTRHQDPSQKVLDAYVWESLDFYGTIGQIRPSNTGNYQLDVAVDSTVFPDSLVWRHPYTLRAALDPDEISLPGHMKLGARIAFKATIYPLEKKRNPYEFDYRQYLASQEIYNHAGIDVIYAVRTPDDLFSWNAFRQLVLDLIDQNFSAETTPLAKALLVGYKNELSRDEKRAFSRAGLSHIMAVSGLHVGFILAPFWLIVPWFWTLRGGRQIGLGLLILLLFLYAGLTGFTASVVRASITGGFIMYGRLFHKIRDSKNLTALAALLILLMDTRELFDIGFQLSFTAVYIILLTMPVITSWLPAWIRYRWYGKPVLIILVSFTVQTGLFPILSYYFGEFSIAGPLVNALVLPALIFVVPWALFLLPFSIFFPAPGKLLNVPNQWYLHILGDIVNITSSIEGSWVQTHVDNPLVFLLWTSALLTIATLTIPRLRWKFICIFAALLCMYQGQEIHRKLARPHLEITIFDVGQGDAALVKTPLDKYFLIDTGRWTPGYNSARYVIIPHLKAIGVDRLDAVFLSHPHADHIGGISELIQKIPIDIIYNSGYRYTSNLYRTYLKQASAKKIPVVSLTAGDVVELDSSMRVFIYGPAPVPFGADPNNHSLVMELVYGSTEFLFTGDAGREQEERLLKNFGDLTDTDFMKVGHHGSRTSSSLFFLKTTTPDAAVVSLAKNNRFGHPHPAAVLRLQQSGTRMYFTSLHGAYVFCSDGNSISQKDWK